MADTSQAAEDAGSAAKDRALASSWPPSKADYEAIGMVAGAAAGTVLGGPIGGAIGAFVGEYVGGIVYELGSYLIADAGYNPASQFVTDARATGDWVRRTAQKLAEDCGTTIDDEYAALIRWGALINPEGSLPIARDSVSRLGVEGAFQALATMQKSIFSASAARIAECQTLHSKPSKNSVGAVIALGVVSAVGIGLIQKFVTRGKF